MLRGFVAGNLACSDFIVTHKSREDWKTSSVRACPCVRTLLIRKQIPDCSGADIPRIPRGVRAEKLVEKTIRIVENEDVAVSGAGIRIAFDRRGHGNGHGPGITFTSVSSEVNRYRRLLGADNEIGNANRRSQVLATTEIRVHSRGTADEIDDRCRIGIYGSRRNALVPKAVRGEWNEASEARALAERHGAAVGGLRRAGYLEMDGTGRAAARVWIVDSHRVQSGRRGRTGCDELGRRDECCLKRGGSKEHFSAVNKFAASESERETARAYTRWIDTCQHRRWIQESYAA